MDPISEMEEKFASITIEEEDQGGLVYEGDVADLSDVDMRWCLVGRFLTESSIDFQAMQHKMASLWKPGRGLYVKDLGGNRFIFQFYHEVDIKRVLDGSPWTFGRFHLILERLKEGDNPRTLNLDNISLWIQLHGMMAGFMSERVVRDIGNYIGVFLESDANNFVGVWREYLRIRVKFPINSPLKRRMKLKKTEESWCWVNFKYEAIPTFCFICGIIGHSDKFCERLFDTPTEQIEKPYGAWMRVEHRRKTHTIGSKWLRQGGVTVQSPAAGSGSKSISGNGGGDVINHVIGGTGSNRKEHDTRDNIPVVTEGHNFQNKSRTMDIDVSENSEAGFQEINGIEDVVVMDPKRRRTEEPIEERPIAATQVEKQDQIDCIQISEKDQKNLNMAGSAKQARPSS